MAASTFLDFHLPVLHKYSFQVTSCFPHNYCWNNEHGWDKNEFCRIDFHQSSERIFAEQWIEPATSCPQVLHATKCASGIGLDKGKVWKENKEKQEYYFSNIILIPRIY